MEYMIVNVPRSHGWRRTRIREATRTRIDAHLPPNIADICMQYMYHPTFPGMSCFETCGILRVRGIGNTMTKYPQYVAFHNVRCPEYPDQCTICGTYIRDINHVKLQCLGMHCLYAILPPSITDRPFIKHDREAMFEFAIQNIPWYVTLGSCLAISFALAVVCAVIERRTGHFWPTYILALFNSTIIKRTIAGFYRHWAT